MPDAFTLRMFVPDGDPEGVRFIDRMNWTGLGVVFPRSKWPEVRNRAEFGRTGVYILTGYSEGDDDLPTVYVGQADGVKGRIDSHVQLKDFWDTGIVFVSNSGGLNRAHVTWLEHALVARAQETKRCHLGNANAPQEPALSEAEKADTQAFLREMLQIMPLVGLRVFEVPRAVAVPGALVRLYRPRSRPRSRRAFEIQSLCWPSKKGLRACSWDRTAGTRYELPAACWTRSSTSPPIRRIPYQLSRTMRRSVKSSHTERAESTSWVSRKRPSLSDPSLSAMRRLDRCKARSCGRPKL